MNLFFWKQKIYTEGSSLLSPTDLGFTRGYGIFDFLRTYDRIPFYFDAHLKRFHRSAQGIDLCILESDDTIRSAVAKLIRAHPSPNIGIKFFLTAGESDNGFFIGDQPNFWITASPLPLSQQKSEYRLKSVPFMRELPEVKTLNYLKASLEAKRFRLEGFDDIVYLDPQGCVLESSTSNLFFIKGNRLITPKNQILEGITRNIVLTLATPDYEIEERPVHLDELSEMEECFLTSTTKELAPVFGINSVVFPSFQKTFLLKKRFHSYIDQKRSEALKFANGEWVGSKDPDFNFQPI